VATFFQPHASSFVALWLPEGCSTPNAGRSCPRACHVRPPVMQCFSQASALRWRRWRRRQWWCRAAPPCDRCAHGGTNCRDDYGFMMHAARWKIMRTRRATGCQEHVIRDRPPAQQLDRAATAWSLRHGILSSCRLRTAGVRRRRSGRPWWLERRRAREDGSKSACAPA